MLTAISNTGDVVIGLSEKNIERLKQNKPIIRDLAFMGVPYKLVIFYGKDEIEMELSLRQAGLVDSDTPRSDLPKGY